MKQKRISIYDEKNRTVPKDIKYSNVLAKKLITDVRLYFDKDLKGRASTTKNSKKQDLISKLDNEIAKAEQSTDSLAAYKDLKKLLWDAYYSAIYYHKKEGGLTAMISFISESVSDKATKSGLQKSIQALLTTLNKQDHSDENFYDPRTTPLAFG